MLSAVALVAIMAQTMSVFVGKVVYRYNTEQTGKMEYTDATLTILNKVYDVATIDSILVAEDSIADNTVLVTYDGNDAQVVVAGNIARYMTVNVNGAHVAILQADDLADEVTYTLQGSSNNGSFWMDGELKASIVLNGVTLTNPDSAAINIRNGKRISVELADGTTSTLADGEGGEQKACFAVKGHTEFKGGGTLNITGNTAHAFWGKEYVQLKKTVGTINVLGAVGDGFNVNQYFQMNGGTVNISGVGDDAIQLSYATDDDGNIEVDTDNTGQVLINGGTLNATTTAAGTKGIKCEGTVKVNSGTLSFTQSGDLQNTGSDLNYTTAIKADENINITGGSITVNNTAKGGKGLSADGEITVDETTGATTLDIHANGAGGTADLSNPGTTPTPTGSYKVYVSIPTSGGGYGPGQSNAWTKVYLYKNDGTLVQQLTNTVTLSSGYSTTTFYYYDFGHADSNTYYFKSDNYTSRGQTYTIRSTSFTGPTSGNDVYMSITNSYTTSGTTRTYTWNDVTSTYSGSTDVSEDNGESYNAAGLKADSNITIDGGTITISNSGDMSKSIKSNATVNINGGDITLTTSGGMKVINNDASYCSAVKCNEYVQSGGSLKITTTGDAAKGISSNNGVTVNDGTLTINNSSKYSGTTTSPYTAKGIKADGNMALNGGTITINMSGQGGKGIKVNGNYTEGTSDGNGPTLTVNTTGNYVSGSSGGWGGGGGVSGSCKGIKVMGTIVIYGGTTEVTTATNGAEGMESKTSIDVRGGKHYFKCYDDCINSAGKIMFNGGLTIAYSNGNDAIDSNANTAGAVTIGNGVAVAYTSAGGPEEGFDCDNNSNIRITGSGIGISGGGSQGGGGGWGGNSGSTITGASQGYEFYTGSISYAAGRYYTLADASGNNQITYSVPTSFSSTLSLFTAPGMRSGQSYTVKYSTTAPTNATTAFHGVYLGSTHQGTTTVVSSTAK